MDIKPYKHHVHYYETDRMGVAHHSNFIRWMEEARVYMMEEAGFGYKRLEEEGIISPVIGIECDYKRMADFDDVILIDAKEEFYNGIKMTIKYTMTRKADGLTVAEGKSRHCFLNSDGRPVNLKKICPELDNIFRELLS
ncbi:acyl-CoA thioesterase [Lachnospiraceae bacterium NSJ-143]|nr:acyl-CoA thioesterase [Lachnospiraceae bacterium NSJ-143]